MEYFFAARSASGDRVFFLAEYVVPDASLFVRHTIESLSQNVGVTQEADAGRVIYVRPERIATLDCARAATEHSDVLTVGSVCAQPNGRKVVFLGLSSPGAGTSADADDAFSHMVEPVRWKSVK